MSLCKMKNNHRLMPTGSFHLQNFWQFDKNTFQKFFGCFYGQNNLICKVTSDSSFHTTSQNNKSNLQYLPELLWRRSKGWKKKAKRFIAPHICTSPLASKDFFQVHKQSLNSPRSCVCFVSFLPVVMLKVSRFTSQLILKPPQLQLFHHFLPVFHYFIFLLCLQRSPTAKVNLSRVSCRVPAIKY